jgi:formylglycine-generating enzyme required for sulfatase activity
MVSDRRVWFAAMVCVASASARADEAALACGDGEAYVPPTRENGFVMGEGTMAERSVVLTRGFCLDQKEVTVKSYKLCVEAGKCKAPWSGDPFSMYPRFDDHPVNVVTWPMARTYCGYVRKRLPTEAEWEWAATGPEQAKGRA